MVGKSTLGFSFFSTPGLLMLNFSFSVTSFSPRGKSPHSFIYVFSRLLGFFFIPDVKVLYVHVLVGRRLPLAPEQEALLGRGLCGGEGKDEEGEEVRRKKREEEDEESAWPRDNPRRRALG